MTHSQQAVVLQQRSLLVAKRRGDVISFIFREDDAVELLVDDMVLKSFLSAYSLVDCQLAESATHIVECTGILRDNVQRSSQRAKGTAMDTVTVRRTVDFGSRGMDGRVDHVGSTIQQPNRSAANDFTVMVDMNQIRPLDLGEGDTERVDPEGGGIDRVPDGDVACDAFVEAEFAKDSECSGEAAFHVFSFLVLVFEDGWFREYLVLKSVLGFIDMSGSGSGLGWQGSRQSHTLCSRRRRHLEITKSAIEAIQNRRPDGVSLEADLMTLE
jgi:hypothetical protein